MKRMSTLLAILAATAATLGMATPVRAQAERSDCASAVAELRAHPRNTTAMWSVSACPSSGPAALSRVWTQRGAVGDVPRGALVEATGLLRDRRLFDGVLGIATASDRPVADRLGALQVLIRYYDPSYVPSLEDLTAEPWGYSIPRRIGGPPPIDGSSPFAQATRGDIGALLSTLASSDDDHTVREAARRLRQVIAFADPVNTPLPAGSITLVGGCGRGVTLRSTADIDVELQLRVLGTSYARAKAISAGSVAKPRQLLLGLPPGIVVASYGGREVARLTERNAPCPVGPVQPPPVRQLGSSPKSM